MAPLKCYTLCDGVSLSKNAVSELKHDSKPWKDRKPIGFHFNPSDPALAKIYVDKFLDRNDNFVLSFFKDIDVYDYEPSELKGSAHEFGEDKMYFFTRIKNKHSTNRSSTRRTIFARTAGGGCWKKNGKISDITIDVEDNSEKRSVSVGKTPLAFHKKDKKSGTEERTPWLMEEYMLKDKKSYENGENSEEKSDVLALCVIYKLKSAKRKIQRCVSGEEPNPKRGPSQNIATDFVMSTDFEKWDFEISGSLSPSELESLMDWLNQQQPYSHGSIDPIADQPPFNLPSGLENMLTPGASDASSVMEFWPINEPNRVEDLLGQSHESSTRIDPAPGFGQWPPSSCFDPNLFYQNAILDNGLHQIKSINNLPALSPGFNELYCDDYQGCQYSVNELGSNQQGQPNSYVPSDQIIQQQPIDSVMMCNRPSQPFDPHLNLDDDA